MVALKLSTKKIQRNIRYLYVKYFSLKDLFLVSRCIYLSWLQLTGKKADVDEEGVQLI